MKPGEKVKEEKMPKGYEKWGEEDFSRMKDHCVSCGKPIEHSRKRFLMSGNYCPTCSFGCGDNMNHTVINIKPYDYD